ncbi:MAG: hypothetical protein WC480_02085 [Patescibacteria group bacterium]
MQKDVLRPATNFAAAAGLLLLAAAAVAVEQKKFAEKRLGIRQMLLGRFDLIGAHDMLRHDLQITRIEPALQSLRQGESDDRSSQLGVISDFHHRKLMTDQLTESFVVTSLTRSAIQHAFTVAIETNSEPLRNLNKLKLH